ncbi:hypothetical protein [Citrobacter telavivensis]
MRTRSIFPGFVRISSDAYILESSGCKIDDVTKSGKCLMDNIYNKMKDFEIKENTVYMYYAYILYAHNSCALVSGDKTYDINKYNNLINEEIRCGKSKTWAKDVYKDKACLK